MTSPDIGHVRPSRVLIRRHSLTVRITHWVNVLCLSILLLSGLQILNAHPRLYWGQYGANADHAFLAVESRHQPDGLHGYLRIGALSIETTGVLGVSREGDAMKERAFPAWLTIPSYHDLGAGRNWHFLFAWLLVANGLLYLAHGLARGHIQRDLLPDRDQLRPRHLWREVLDHARLRFAKGEHARRYNALQKITYALVALVLLPMMVLTGLTMSPGLNAGFPFLLDLFGGRASARSLHFLTASSLVLFVVVHVAMVVLSGFWNNIRSMIDGRYAIDRTGDAQ
ncbi:cytochrome b/b6 domain-containing protein [Bordetella genomosp. 13]|uniref:cytochrome b/b6 domain-containing protein n=1 Tax=Bordetella genomosp. 13 TaxID=463040 RepID=UPI0011A068B5|nr:cytochrome b/b6 domain-containing protein [Bordetella genomosp. 13]